MANNLYGSGDIAGLGRRVRLGRGQLDVIAVTVASARQAAGLLAGTHGRGLRVFATTAIEITADADRIPVGIDGEAVTVPSPVQCTVRPGALRVWVPRNRPGIPPPKPPVSWARLRHLAAPGRTQLSPGSSPNPGAV